MSLNDASPLPTLSVMSDDGAHVEFHQFSMWDEGHSEFKDPPASYYQSLVNWLYDRFDAYHVDLDGPYIYLRVMALPGPSLRPFKIAGRIVVWLSPDDDKSVTNAGTLQSQAEVQVDDEDYASLVPYTLPDSHTLIDVFINCFKRAMALTYLGDHLVVEMPPAEPIPAEYEKLKFQIPVSFTSGPLFERFALENAAAAYATGAQCGLRRLATLEDRSSWLEVDHPLRYNESVRVPRFPPRYRHLSCQGLRIYRRDWAEAEASETSQTFAQHVFVTGKILRESRAPPIPAARAPLRHNKICPLFLPPPHRRKKEYARGRRRRISSLDGLLSAADPPAAHTNNEQQVTRNTRAPDLELVSSSSPKFYHGTNFVGDGRIYTQVEDSDGIFGSFYEYYSC